MARVCELTGKRPAYGNKVSHSNIKTRRRWDPNLVDKRYLIPELARVVKLRLSTRAIRTIDKQGGITSAILKADPTKLSSELFAVRSALIKRRRQ